jgi:hypothetical protein
VWLCYHDRITVRQDCIGGKCPLYPSGSRPSKIS